MNLTVRGGIVNVSSQRDATHGLDERAHRDAAHAGAYHPIRAPVLPTPNAAGSLHDTLTS